MLHARRLGLAALTTCLAIAPAAVLAQNAAAPPDPGSRDARRAAINASLPQEFGPACCSILQIPAAACQNFQTFWNPAAGGYLYPLDPGQSYCWAPVELPTGVVVTFVDLYFDDTDGSSDVDAALLLNPGYSNSLSTHRERGFQRHAGKGLRLLGSVLPHRQSLEALRAGRRGVERDANDVLSASASGITARSAPRPPRRHSPTFPRIIRSFSSSRRSRRPGSPRAAAAATSVRISRSRASRRRPSSPRLWACTGSTRGRPAVGAAPGLL